MWSELERAIDAGAVIAYGATPGWAAWLAAQRAAQLVSGGWTRTPVVDEPGTFALRGGVIDVYAPLASHPVRIELEGDAIDSLRAFDGESQRTLREIDRVVLHPVRETIATGA